MNAGSYKELEGLHPSVWRASQLARSTTRCIDTGYPELSRQIGGKGWPTGSLIELLVQQAGVGELRLLAPALASVAKRQVVMIEPPHPPHIVALAGMGLEPANVIWIRSKVSADTLWATEQVLRSGSYGAVLLWANHMRQESLRRLHLASQAGDTLFYVIRPLAAAQDASPSPLRLSLRPAPAAIEVGFVKRRGPATDQTLIVPLPGPVHRVERAANLPNSRPKAPSQEPIREPFKERVEGDVL